MRAFPFRIKRQRPVRLGAFEAVEIEVGKGLPPHTGILKDISETGALIHVEAADTLPSRVRISIHALKILAEADVRWRKDDNIGVRFLERVDLGGLPEREKNDRRAVVAAHFRSKLRD